MGSLIYRICSVDNFVKTVVADPYQQFCNLIVRLGLYIRDHCQYCKAVSEYKDKHFHEVKKKEAGNKFVNNVILLFLFTVD